MKLLASANTPVEDQTWNSNHAAEAKLPSMDKIQPRPLGAGAANSIIDGLERIVTRRIADNLGPQSPVLSKLQRKSGFFSPKAPSISIKKYLDLCIYKRFNCSDECFVLALIYINRITKMQPTVTLCSVSAHRLVFFAVLVATKYHDDERYSNSYYAKCGGLPLDEVNMAEANFLKMLDWKLNVEPKEYQFYHGLMRQASNHEGPLPPVQLEEPEAEP